jgi:Uma2 family endonuclease
MSTGALKRYTVREYLERERTAETKSEFFDGEIFAMAGANETHNLIASNVLFSLRLGLRGRRCRVYSSDMRVRTPSGLYTYPDVTVVCGKPELEGGPQDVLLNPLILFEVLSPSTETYDRGRKFQNYQTIPSLKEYVLVSQDRRLVEHYVRQEGTNSWVLNSYTDGEFRLPALGVTLAFEDLYEQVES